MSIPSQIFKEMRLDALALSLAIGILAVWGDMGSSRYFPDHLHIEPGVVAEFAIIAGLVVCLYGFRLLRTMTLCAGFSSQGCWYQWQLKMLSD